MKTPDEIKKGLECASNCSENLSGCKDCPYNGLDCCDLHPDAMTYIRQLERERDAAVETIKEEMGCRACAKYTFTENYVSTDCLDCINECNWEWRGVKEE